MLKIAGKVVGSRIAVPDNRPPVEWRDKNRPMPKEPPTPSRFVAACGCGKLRYEGPDGALALEVVQEHVARTGHESWVRGDVRPVVGEVPK